MANLDPSIEVVLPNHLQLLPQRFEMGIFFIVGGADDLYLSNQIGQPILNLVLSKSVDVISLPGPFVVYTSRALLPLNGYCRIFQLADLVKEEWAILTDLTDPTSVSIARPTDIERTWIIRALRRIQVPILFDLANRLEYMMLRTIYPLKLTLRFSTLSVNFLADLYLRLSDEQRNYPLIIVDNGLPIRLNWTLGNVLTEIVATRCSSASREAIITSLNLLQLS